MTEPDEQDPKEEPSAFDCQDCGVRLSLPLTSGFAKKEGGKAYVAGLCPDCMVKRMGLEWREVKRSSILVAGQQKGVL